jgi:hypothetical protein
MKRSGLLIAGILLLAAPGCAAAEEACLTEPCSCVTQGDDGATEIDCPQPSEVVDTPGDRVPSVSASPPCVTDIVPDGRRAITLLSLVVPVVAWLILHWLVGRV